jgi:hypothetical protein
MYRLFFERQGVIVIIVCCERSVEFENFAKWFSFLQTTNAQMHKSTIGQ